MNLPQAEPSHPLKNWQFTFALIVALPIAGIATFAIMWHSMEEAHAAKDAKWAAAPMDEWNLDLAARELGPNGLKYFREKFAKGEVIKNADLKIARALDPVAPQTAPSVIDQQRAAFENAAFYRDATTATKTPAPTK